MAGNSPHHPCILVVDLALHNAMPEGCVVFGRWHVSLIWMSGEIEADSETVERLEDLAFPKSVQSFTREPLQGDAEQDEADVAIFGMGAWISHKRYLVCLGQQLGAVFGGFKELYVRGQSG